MAANRRSHVPDARATPEIEAAMRQIDQLIPLAGATVTITTQQDVPNELHNWDLVAPAMLFSATSCLVSLRWLAEAQTPRRDEDAIVLLRRLYEHVVIFAWIAIDPARNAPRWVAEDYQHRLRADSDLARIARRRAHPGRAQRVSGVHRPAWHDARRREPSRPRRPTLVHAPRRARDIPSRSIAGADRPMVAAEDVRGCLPTGLGERTPDGAEPARLRVAWRCVKHVPHREQRRSSNRTLPVHNGAPRLRDDAAYRRAGTGTTASGRRLRRVREWLIT